VLVATFGPSTAWHGREIIWDLDHFILVGHGGIPAAGLLDYDRLGQIVWARPEYRPWAFQVDRWERGASAAPGPAAQGYGAGAYGAAAGHTGRRFPTWAIVLIVVGVLALVLAVAAAVVIPAFVLRTAETFTNDMQVRSGLQTIRPRER
jgi:hypothetical protein